MDVLPIFLESRLQFVTSGTPGGYSEGWNAAVFIETHQDPDHSGTAEASTMVPLKQLPALLKTLIALDRIAKRPSAHV